VSKVTVECYNRPNLNVFIITVEIVIFFPVLTLHNLSTHAFIHAVRSTPPPDAESTVIPTGTAALADLVPSVERSRSDDSGEKTGEPGETDPLAEENEEEEEEAEGAEDEHKDGFLAKLLAGAGKGWRYVRLTVDGHADFYFSDPSGPEGEPVRHATLGNIRHESVDAESKAVIWSYADERTIVSMPAANEKWHSLTKLGLSPTRISPRC
jgi:hypothetical protein